MLSRIGKRMIFVGYEDGFEGQLIAGETVFVYDEEDEDVCYVHPVRNRRVAGHLCETVFGTELQAGPEVALL
jgi:hypothetical protein